ncbi:DUF2963 domain-containing protein [New Jersey aster yellows phytoplasma]|uniref:DUF2963 domain-containing protein n=1 Tax=New Jersey aster yellows phytoplasma TaxID=270520 RepID=A0ABX4K2F9_9MOLU|nr:DUF2963 domain-containing protein [New Jersey aster yellows phytoplasma]PEH36300.1 hypothetical protein BBA70_01690 [New Jersey aster yellows phytoplasma]
MSSFRIGNKHYKIIPFLITTGTLIFFVFWIGGISYKYHLETEERRKLQEVDIKAKARELNNDIYIENKKLKEENEHLKSVPYEFIRGNGEKEYYNLFTHKLVKKIDNDNNIFEYDKNNGLLLKKTDKYNNVEEYGSHGKLIKKTLSDGVWMEYNPINSKLMKRKNIDNSIEEFDDNEEKFKEIDKNGKVKFFKTKLYKYPSEIDYYDGKTIYYIEEYDQQTGKLITRTIYRPDGKTIYYIEEYDQQTGKIIKETTFESDGKTIDYIEEYDHQTGKIINKIYYNPDGTIKKIINH